MSENKTHKCDGTMFVGNDLRRCNKKATHITEFLIYYCDKCFAEYEKAWHKNNQYEEES